VQRSSAVTVARQAEYVCCHSNPSERMMLRHSLVLVTTTVTLSACGDVITSPDVFPDATAARSCGPTDGPAVTIQLARDSIQSMGGPRPAINLFIWRGIGDIAGRSFRLEQNSNDGFATRVWLPATPRPILESLTGTVDIRRVEPDSTIVGFLDVRFTDGTRFARTFSARWRPTPGFACG
jgi:hypothetical protein